jgi:hypothetical protein
LALAIFPPVKLELVLAVDDNHFNFILIFKILSLCRYWFNFFLFAVIMMTCLTSQNDLDD